MDGTGDSRGNEIPGAFFNGRLIGLDFGSRTVGVAVSDELGMLARSVETVRRKKPDKLRTTLSRIAEIISYYGVNGVVIGWPVHFDGSEGVRCGKTDLFGKMLAARVDVPLIYWDERLTTVEADELMRDAGKTDAFKSEHIDETAAMVILQDFLDHAHRMGWYGTD